MIKSVVVTIAGSLVTDPIGSVVLKQQVYGHELLVFTVKRRTNVRAGSLWDPVYVKWTDTNGTFFEFWGYFYSAEYAGSMGQWVNTQTVYCIGTTMPMKSMNPKVMGRGTASYAIRTVVGGYSLGADVDSTGTVLSSVVQGQETDWAFICRMAMQAGLLVYARGPRVVGVDPLRVIADPRLYSRGFNMERGPGTVNTMISFNIIEDQLGANATKQVNLTAMGVDGQSGNLLRTSSSGGTQIGMTAQGEAVTSVADAQRLVNSGARLSTNWVSAKAELVSSPSTTAASTVSLTGAGVGTAYAGLWLVTEATHTLTWDFNISGWTGITDAVLGRDRPYAASFLVNRNMTRPKPPTAAWAGNRWVNQGSAS